MVGRQNITKPLSRDILASFPFWGGCATLPQNSTPAKMPLMCGVSSTLGRGMFLIKNNEATFMLWWKFIGAIVMTIFMVFAVREGTLFIPVRGEVITMENSPIMFRLLIVSFVLMAMLSYWQVGYGLYQKYFNGQAKSDC